jgi:N-acetylmuramoyl-L-alanine amidase
MRKYRTKAAGVLAAVCIGTILASGCGKGDYQKMETVLAEEESGLEEKESQEKEGNQPETSRIDRENTMAPAPVFTDVSDTVYIKGNNVRLRTVPDTSDSRTVAAVLNSGTSLSRTGDSQEWCRVSYNGQVLYVYKSLITTQKPQALAETTAPAGQAAGQAANSAQISNGSQVAVDSSWKYADYSAIKSGTATMYRSEAANRKGITICVNAGHGTSGGGNVKTKCHPDGTAKVTGGTTGAGATEAIAVSSGMTFLDGTAEAKVTLAMAKVFKEKLLAEGYDVLMIRESDDVQLDNIARTVLANNRADCHIALHWDSTTSDKGAFYMSVPNVASYRAMEPVASNWQKHNNLGESLIAGLKGAGVKIFSGGSMEMDLTQTSYSTVPSIDIELGDKASDHSAPTLDLLASGLVEGVNQYFGK